MPSASLSHVLSRLRGIWSRRESDEQTDGRLLELFLSRQDEHAFELLVRRYGPMVLGVCRRVLGDAHDAEDAFQATFLVLVRRGETIRPRERVGNWLYGVAYRTALEARRATARRRRKEAQAMPHPQPTDDPWTELRPMLDRELNNLPERYRLPLLLCDLEGMTRKEAAHQLGWAEGTVSSRLSRARVLLARRLRRHGVTLTAVAMAGILGANAASARVPAPLVISTVKAARLTAVGQTAAARLVAGEAVALMEKVVRNMGILKLKFVAAGLLVVGVIAGLAYHGLAEQPGKQDTPNTVQAADRVVVRAEAPREKKVEEKAAASVKEMPPVVVRTVPQAGDTAVDAAKIKEIRVTFSKDMMDKSWSWVQISKETFPKHDGEVHYDKDGRTCIMPVKLEAGKTYVIWLNSERYDNFKDIDGNSAVPYLLVFETKPKE